ncbi:hypothetical protein [Paenibacillus sp. PL91]|uniref:hypothetical protein n=1 Tax=Paenibacillus sp. PL91 TaxID=2729538 RepID=UPI00145FCF67|nr:hypothetical protein [Paenibacillus sp. PL91]MBC9200432.1 hypothetical protein [Paenibacillus sp. PL91]
MLSNMKMDIKLLKKDWILLSIISLISLTQFIYFVDQNSVENYYDEKRYYDIGINILNSGLFNIADDLRTYLYPFLISLFYIFTDGQAASVKILFSVFQFIIYLITVLMIARTAYDFQKRKTVFFTILVFGLLNPYLIQSTTLLLTDLLASCFLIISLMYLLKSDLNKLSNGAIVASLLYAAVLIRPSSAIFMILFFLIALYRVAIIKNFKPIRFIIIGLLLLILFFPQLYMNITKFNHFTPLIHINLLEQQSVWATQLLKYGTVVIDGENPGLRYVTPWIMNNNISMFQLMSSDFFVFVGVLVVHIFGLFDWGYVDTYINDLAVSTRLLPSILLYIQWFLIGMGVLYLKLRKQHTFMTVSLVIASVGYALFIATTAIESRFGYPIYLIMLFFSGFGVQYIYEYIYNKKALFYIFSSLLFVICISLYFSYFIDMQTERIIWFK